MSEQSDVERIKRQIQALLSLSSSPNPHEAASAAAKAQALLVKHHLSMAEVEERRPDLQLPVGHIDMRLPGIIQCDWVTRLADAIARANLCGVLYSKHSVTFIGRTDNVELACYMMRNLHLQLVNMVRDAVKAHTQECKRQGLSVIGGINDHQVYRRSWLIGAAREISNKMWDGFNDFASSNNGMAIVDLNESRIKAYKQMTWPHIGTFKTGRVHLNGRGYAKGREAGAEIAVQAAIKSATSTRQIGAGS